MCRVERVLSIYRPTIYGPGFRDCTRPAYIPQSHEDGSARARRVRVRVGCPSEGTRRPYSAGLGITRRPPGTPLPTYGSGGRWTADEIGDITNLLDAR